MGVHPNELEIPNVADGDQRALEIARIWAARGKLHVSIATGLWDDPASWGIMLVDLAQHVANAYEQIRGDSRDAVLNRIKQGMDAEWSHRTDVAIGKVID